MKFSILLLAALSGVASFPISFIKNVNALKCIRNYAFSSPKLDVYRFRTPMKTLKISSEDKNYVVEGPFQGQYGLWYVDSRDAEEVLAYRGSLLASAIFVIAGLSFAMWTPPPVAEWALDVCAIGFLASFGVSLATIHIYMKPLHRMLQVLWAAGVFGSVIATASSPSHHLVLTTYNHPELLLASGWVFVSLTGLFFKEFACFQRWEASALFALVPVLAGGHFLKLFPAPLELIIAETFAAIFIFFALRKFGQSFKADIGDKSIFEHLARQETKE